MSVFAMESQYMKTIMIHLADKSDFIPSDQQIFAVNPVELGNSEDCDFSCIKLALQKVSVSRKYKPNQEISIILTYKSCYKEIHVSLQILMLLLVFSTRFLLQILIITRTNGDMGHFARVGN